MITATPRPAPPSFVRSAREEDAPALAALSEPFARSGALRSRPLSLYAAQAADFLVLETPGGELAGCVGVSAHAHPLASAPMPAPASPPAAGSPSGSAPVAVLARPESREQAGVLYNFCVAGHHQGHGAGAQLLHAVLHMAHAQSLNALFTATTGDGHLFIRHGFTPTAARLAPPSWTKSLDPRRNARLFVREL